MLAFQSSDTLFEISDGQNFGYVFSKLAIA